MTEPTKKEIHDMGVEYTAMKLIEQGTTTISSRRAASTKTRIETDQYDDGIECEDLTWTSSDIGVGTMNGSVFTVDKKGNTTIEASCEYVTSNPIDITVIPGQKMLAHCQKFIHSNGHDQWNDSAWMNKTHPCNYTV